MELWVRSQNKGALVKVEILGYTNGTICSYSGNNKITLGEYSSAERALEVLDEIQKILNPMIIFTNCKCTQDVIENIKEAGACFVTNDAHIEQVSTCVYEMPEE